MECNLLVTHSYPWLSLRFIPALIHHPLCQQSEDNHIFSFCSHKGQFDSRQCDIYSIAHSLSGVHLIYTTHLMISYRPQLLWIVYSNTNLTVTVYLYNGVWTLMAVVNCLN